MWDERQKNILKLLLSNLEGINGTALSEEIGVSARTIRSDIVKINFLLKPYNCKILSDNKKGYYVLGENAKLIARLLSEITLDSSLKLLGIIFFSDKINIDDLADSMYYSSSKIYKDIYKLQKNIFKKMDFSFFSINGNIITVEKDESKIRKCFLIFLQEENFKNAYFSDSSIKELFYNNLNQKKHENLMYLIQDSFMKENIVLSDEVFFLIHWAIYFFVVRNCKGYLLKSHKNKDEIMKKSILKKISHKIQFFYDNDIDFLDEFMWSLRLFKYENETLEDTENAKIIEEFLTEVFQKYNLNLKTIGELLNNLKSHIEYMLRRLQSGYSFENPLKSNVKDQYTLAYEISMLIVPIVYKYKHQYLLEGEISYVAVYIQYCIEEMFNLLKVVLVSRSNSVILKIIKDWLIKNFANKMEILTAINLQELDIYLENNNVDLIIFTTNPTKDYEIPTYTLEEIPSSIDMVNITNLIHGITISTNNYKKNMIENKLTQNLFKIFEETSSFEEVLKYMCDMLEHNGNIDCSVSFYKDLIYRESIYPTFLNLNMMMPHPLKSYANKSGIFVGLFPNGIKCFDSHVKIILVLALEPKLDIEINQLFKILRNISTKKRNLDLLSKSKSYSSFIKTLLRLS